MGRLLDCTLFLALCALAAHAQYNDDFGPAPPRLQIPGAVSLGPAPPRRPPPLARLQGRRQQAPQPPQFDDAPKLRSRGPGARAGRLPLASPAPSPTPAPQYFSPPPPQRISPQPEESLPPRPVVEEAEDDYADEPIYSPSPSPSTTPPPPPPPPQPQRPAPSPSPLPAFRPERPLPVFRPERPAVLPTPSPELNYVSPTRQQLRPTALPVDEDVRSRKPYKGDQSYNSRNKVRPTAAIEQQQFSRQPPQQTQQQFNRAQNVVRAPPKPAYTTSSKDGFEKPERQYQRPRKPTAQVLRRYREDNEDGSITWGFENDDGSFKEETIGTDCVTYGKYGYIDPDGTRREYTYSTGIPCDKTAEDAQTQGSEGYIDYAENKYVLPNGDKVDLNKMGKGSRRTAAAQPQQQYRS